MGREAVVYVVEKAKGRENPFPRIVILLPTRLLGSFPGPRTWDEAGEVEKAVGSMITDARQSEADHRHAPLDELGSRHGIGRLRFHDRLRGAGHLGRGLPDPTRMGGKARSGTG
ncbi:MAG: hypothetical protein SCH98_16825 [Deferrisomatales bacterium]|nr:hypothetical protein [Deferrisomatales bacterium]